jgi:hypothetical protein
LTLTATSEEAPPSSVDLLPGYWVDPEAFGAWKTIPWPRRGSPAHEELLRNSLGPALIDWAEGRTDKPGLIDYHTGLPWRFTDGQKRFLILWYAVWGPDTIPALAGRFRFRSGMKRGAKGTGKDPLAAAMCDMELLAAVRFAGWTGAGQAYGVPHGMPLVQIAANSEGQAKDVLRIANAMLSGEARAYYGLECGETRPAMPTTGGRIELLTSSEKSSEGDPATFIAVNESHHMTEASGGMKVAEVARRNVGKSPRELQARACEFSNAHQQGSDSHAERTYEEWQKQVSGLGRLRDLLYDSIEAAPTTNLNDDESRMLGLRQAYSDAPWADLDRLSNESLDSRTSIADSIRYYLNGLAAAEDAWVEPANFDALANPERVVRDGEQVAVFADLSKSGDATGVVGCCLDDGHIFVLGVWQKPHGEKGKTWLVPRNEVDAVIRASWDRYDVVWTGIDPSPAEDDETEALYWQPMIDGLHRDRRNARGVLWGTPGVNGNAVLFDMRLSQSGGLKRNQAFTEEAMATALAIDEEKTLSHDGDATLRAHTHNAKRRPNPWGTSLSKATRSSSKKVDLAVCMVGARLGRRLALNSGKVKKKRTGSGGRRVGVVL